MLQGLALCSTKLMMTEFPPNYSIEAVWPFPSSEIREQVARFWLSEGALLDEQRAKKRATELILVVHTNNQQVAAVSTARKVLVRQLDLKCFYYRMFVGRQHRTNGLLSTDLVRHVLARSYQVLNDRYQCGHDQDCAGLYMEVENESVKRHRNQTVWCDLGANVVYIGNTPQGDHARVWYFQGSCIG